MKAKNCILSPVEGKIIYKKTKCDFLEFLKNRKVINVGIYLSPFNIHFFKSPIDGKIVKIWEIDGKILRMKNPFYEKFSKKIILEIRGKIRVFLIILPAKFFGRIMLFKKKGQKVFQGENLGFITLGSQVNLIVVNLPKTWKTIGKLKAKISIGGKLFCNSLE